MYYVAKVQLVERTENSQGRVRERKVTEQYLVEAMSVTEAEAKVIKDFGGNNSTFEYEVKSVTASKILKIIE